MKKKRASKPKSPKLKKWYTLERKIIGQVRFYETLYLVRDNDGERIYTGSEESAKRIQKLLNASRRK